MGSTPIIGLTANAERSKHEECGEAGMNGFASKPVTAERLAAAINAGVCAADTLLLLDAGVLAQLTSDIVRTARLT